MAKTTEHRTTIEPPMPIERIAEAGKSNRLERPIETASPLKTTALPAVATAFSTASSVLRPRASSSRKRLTMKSE